MASDAESVSPSKAKKPTEITDLPDASVNSDEAGEVKGGGTIVPCISPAIPCIRSIVPCVRPVLPPGSYKPGGH